MNKGKAIGGCLGIFLLTAFGIGLIGWIITTIYPKSYPVISLIGGGVVIIALWNAVSSFIKILKQKEEPVPSAEIPPADPGTQVQ